MKRALATRILAILLALSMVVPAWSAKPGPELPNPGTPGMSKEQQEQLGLQAVGEVYKQFPVLPDSSPVTQYVQQLGRKMTTVIPQEYSWPYQFHVIPQKEINAFALPGGPIFVNVGTITAADNEAELAGVIAHEMSHVYMQHSAKSVPKQQAAQIIGALAGLLGGGTAGSLARLGIQIGAGTLLMKYSRGDEAQADAVGAIIMYKAGYDPKAMAEFFEKLEKEGGGSGPQFLSDHPNPGNRVKAVSNEIADWPRRKYQSSSSTFASAKQKASGMRVYTAQEIADGAKQGVWAKQNQQGGAVPPANTSANAGQTASSGNLANVTFEQVKPSENLTQLSNNVFSIAYPDNWKTGGDQNSVLIAPPAGAAQGAIAYGVTIGGGRDPNASSLDEATQNLVQSITQSNQGLRATGSPQSISVNGVQGRSVTLTGNSPVTKDGKPVPERDWLVTIPASQGGLLYLVFTAPENDFSRLRSTYERMLDSLQVK
jgi:beta-barrel assembly-enhancing protease